MACSGWSAQRRGRGPLLDVSLFAIFLAAVVPQMASGAQQGGAVPLANFEGGFPVQAEDKPGFLPRDKGKAAALSSGARGSGKFGRFFFAPGDNSAFLQHSVRRRFLATGTSLYETDGVNALSFWIRLPHGSHLISDGSKRRFGVWTYHWDRDDPWVGGSNNRSGTTDSMMHGYSDLWFLPGAEERWIRVVLGTSAFRIQREYYHFYAAAGVTGPVGFFPSLRQLQFTVLGPFDTVQSVDLDEIELIRSPRTASIEPGFARQKVGCEQRDVAIPVAIRNPTEKARRYRVFVSSCLGAGREVLNRAFFESDGIEAMPAIQDALQADGGISVAELVPDAGDSSGASGPTEIEIPARGLWKGSLVHHIRPEMLGPVTWVHWKKLKWAARRDTLTTSVIVWDPSEPSLPDMKWVRCRPSNADDGAHDAPAGFPEQVRPPEGWRSEDIPVDQAAGYFVSEIVLE